MFSINIELGNAEMSSPKDVAKALRDVARKLLVLGDDGGCGSIKIFDSNGNYVGVCNYDFTGADE